MELTANAAEAYLVGGKLEKERKRNGKGSNLYKIQGHTYQLHIHIGQRKTRVKYRTQKLRNIH